MPTGYVSPTGFNDLGSSPYLWQNETNIYDGNTGTSGQVTVAPSSWSPFIELTIAQIRCTKVQFWAYYQVGFFQEIDIDVYDTAWQHVWDGTFADMAWVEKNLDTTRNITKARVRFYNMWIGTYLSQLYEFQFYKLVPAVPTALATDTPGTNSLHLSWTKGSGAYTTHIRRKAGSYPTSISDGVQAYNSTGSSCTDNGLLDNTAYYYRAWSVNEAGTPSDTYAQATGTTLAAGVATVTTQAVTAIEKITATGHGNITSLGGDASCDKRGICWNTTGTPTIADSKTEESGTFYTGAFSEAMTSLVSSTLYYVRAYAHNTAGYGYGNEVQVTTKPTGPTAFTATKFSAIRIDLAWTKNASEKTMIRYRTDAYPTSPSDGTQAYFDVGSSYSHTVADADANRYYYAAWAFKTGAPNSGYSDDYSVAAAGAPLGAYITPEGYTDPSSGWTVEDNARDGNTGTAALCTSIAAGAYGSFLELFHNRYVQASKLRVWTGKPTPASAIGNYTSVSTYVDVWGVNWVYQTFTTGAKGLRITQAMFSGLRVGSPGTVTLGIRATSAGKPTGGDLTSGTSNGNGWALTMDSHYFTLTEYALAASTMYAIVVRAPSGDAGNKIEWRKGDAFAGGNPGTSGDSGGTWTAQTYDMQFFCIGYIYLDIDIDVFDVGSASWVDIYAGAWTPGAYADQALDMVRNVSRFRLRFYNWMTSTITATPCVYEAALFGQRVNLCKLSDQL